MPESLVEAFKKKFDLCCSATLLWMERQYFSVNGGGMRRDKHNYLWQFSWAQPGGLHQQTRVPGFLCYGAVGGCRSGSCHAVDSLLVPGYGALHLSHHFPGGKIRDNSIQAFQKV